MDFQDLSSLVDADSDLFKILDNDVMNEIQSSERLKQFYKKLIETDAQIRNLKKNNEASINNIDFEDKYKTYPERVKRSLKNFQKPWKLFHLKKNKKDKGNKIVNRKEKITADKDKMDDENLTNNGENKEPSALGKDSKQKHQKANRSKRFDNASKPEEFLIEDKKILIQYKPNYNRKSKCSHAPKDSKSHENQLKHPFYQNTQRIDELLDKFLDRNFPEIMANQFGLDLVFQNNKNKCKHPKTEVDALNKDGTPEKPLTKVKSITQTKIESKVTGKGIGIDDGFTNAYGTESSTVRNVMFNDLEFGDGARKREDTTTNNYGLLMSISTMMYPENTNFKRNTIYTPSPLINRVPNARKLLQADADDDMNEVMVKNDGQDEVNKEKRNKRTNGLTLEDMKNIVKSNFALSPNWKGPMPLYPDELNSMVKQVPETPVLNKYNLETDKKPVAVNKAKDFELNSASEIEENIVNKVEIPVSKDSPSEIDEFEVNLSDMEYIEDYFRDKYDRLVEKAQAYSDYGVLDGKKMGTEKKVDDKVKLEVPNRSIKFTFKDFKEGFKNNLFGRPKKGNLGKDVPSEGFRLEYKPTPSSGDDMPVDMYKEIKKHIKVASKFMTETIPDPSPIDSNIDFIYTPITNQLKTTTNTIPESNGIIFSIGKKRTLKSVEIIDKILETTPDDNLEDAMNSKENGLKSVHLKFKREVSNNLLTDDNNVTSDAKKLGVVDEFVNCTVKVDAKELDSTNMKADEQDGISSNSTTESSDANNNNLSDFFMTLASWFSALDGVDFNFDRNILRNSSSSLPNNTEAKVTNKTVDIIYPEYDSDMIENIGHRSRVLLSVEDVNATVKIEHSDGKDKGITEVDNHTDPKNIILTTNKPKATNITENKTKTIVKRNAESNLIFWNDLYDDEYGVAVDQFESNVRDKHSITKSDLMKIPQEWFRSKVRKIADGIHRKAESLRKIGKTGGALKTGKAKNIKEEAIKGETKKINKRVSRTAIEDDLGLNKKTDFAALTANMKKICRKAAKDIELAKRVDVREVSKDGQVTSSLMQQLVRLMGDLVDYQVKQRTCRKLPPDLQEFLEWLMSSSSESDADKYSSYKSGDFHNVDFGKVSDKSDSLGISFSERDTPDSRSNCLGTLQAVQALMQQYEDLGEDDKLYNTDSIRFRRDVSTDETPIKHKKRSKLGQIIKNLIRKIGRKHHTNNTSSDVKYNNDIEKESKKKNTLKVENKDVKIVKEKRNLRDVYFKALADAKKLTTVKGHDIFSHT